jgi:hypothetical protein
MQTRVSVWEFFWKGFKYFKPLWENVLLTQAPVVRPKTRCSNGSGYIPKSDDVYQGMNSTRIHWVADDQIHLDFTFKHDGSSCN